VSCLALDQIAAAAGEDLDLDHVAECPRCAALLDEQRAIRTLAGALPPVRLSADRRAELAAEVMAAADAPVPRRHHRFVIAMGGALAIATVVIMVAMRGRANDEIPSVQVAQDVPAIELSGRIAMVEPPPTIVAEPIAVLRGDAELTRDTTPERDVVTLRGGSISIDTSQTRSLEVVAGPTRIIVARARAAVTARGGVIEQVVVFAGSVELTADGHRHVIEAGATWDRLLATSAIDEFRTGWTALRAGDHAAAIAAFDRAVSPVVAEDAVYWAAVAAERAGQRAEAARRFADFVTRFATSPRADAARSAIERLR